MFYFVFVVFVFVLIIRWKRLLVQVFEPKRAESLGGLQLNLRTKMHAPKFLSVEPNLQNRFVYENVEFEC